MKLTLLILTTILILTGCNADSTKLQECNLYSFESDVYAILDDSLNSFYTVTSDDIDYLNDMDINATVNDTVYGYCGE